MLSRRELLFTAAASPLAGEHRTVLAPAAEQDMQPVIAQALERAPAVLLRPGTYWLHRPLVVPAGVHLQGSGVAQTVLRLRSTGSNASEAVVILSDGASLSSLLLDGGLGGREASGELRTHVFGAVIRDASRAHIADCGVVDAGATAIGAKTWLPNGGGYLIEMTSAARGDVFGNVVERSFSDCPRAGFHCRMLSPFRGPEPAPGFWLRNNLFRGVNGSLGIKNGIELAGPRTVRNEVVGCKITNPLGQGGIEADLGAGLNRFTDCELEVRPRTAGPAFDGFSQRTSVSEGVPLRPSYDNEFVDCSVYGDVDDTHAGFRAFVDHGATRRSRFIRPKCDVRLVRTTGVGRGVCGYYQEARYGTISDAVVTDPVFRGVDDGVRLAGPFATTGLRVRGGAISARRAAISESRNARPDGVELRGVRLFAPEPAADGMVGVKLVDCVFEREAPASDAREPR